MTPGFDAFENIVRELWPTYRASVQPMWDTRVYQYPTEQIGCVLRQFRADYPDDTKPIWKTIYGMLAGGKDGNASKSDLQELLDFMRRTISKDAEALKRKPVNAWTDADCLERYIEANAQMRDLDGEALPDDDGRRARLAASWRRATVGRYVRDLKARGEPVPGWLVR